MCILFAYMFVYYVHARAYGNQKWVLCSKELELHEVDSHHLGAVKKKKVLLGLSQSLIFLLAGLFYLYFIIAL